MKRYCLPFGEQGLPSPLASRLLFLAQVLLALLGESEEVATKSERMLAREKKKGSKVGSLGEIASRGFLDYEREVSKREVSEGSRGSF
jgi:hypothetical protein